MLPEPLTIMTLDADHLAGGWRDVFALIWRGPTTLRAIESVGVDFDCFAAERTGRYAIVVIIEARAPVPDGTVRSAMASILREHERRIAASAVAMEGTGFRAAAVRSVLAGMAMLVRPCYPHRVFGTVHDSADWLAATCATELSPFAGTDLRQALVDARARHSPVLTRAS